MIVIENCGAGIARTNYWDSDLARRGFMFLTSTAGVMRLLVPDTKLWALADMRTGRIAVVSRGPFKGADAVEILFDDESEQPFTIVLSVPQVDCLPPNGDSGREVGFTVWTRAGMQMELEGRFRVVESLPCAAPWEGPRDAGK